MRRNAFVLAVTISVALAVAAVAYAGNGGIAPPGAESPNAQRVRDAYWLILALTGAIFVLVEGALVVFLVRYRRGGRPREVEGPQIHGSTKLEVAWTVAPVVILAAIGTFVFYKLPGIENVPEARAGAKQTIRVEGRQFYWFFRYPNGAVSIDRMVAPEDDVVEMKITAPDWDVIHSWWVPKLFGKFDAIPGQVNTTWFRTRHPGSYVARCAELCGVQHALMQGHVDVRTRDEYEAFLDARKGGGRELGKEEWNGVCSKCHRLDEAAVGPPLRGNLLLRDREGLETLVRNGRGKMPAVARGWSDDQIDALVAYTKRFAGGTGGGAG